MEQRVEHANALDQAALNNTVRHNITAPYPGANPEFPQGGLSQTNVDASRSVGETLLSKDANGNVSTSIIRDINVILANDTNKVIGYVYGTTDNKLFIQADASAKGVLSGGAGVGPVSVGYTPPTGTAAERLLHVEQLPTDCRVVPGPMSRDGHAASHQLVPQQPRQHLEEFLHGNHLHADLQNGGAVAVDPKGPLNAHQALGSPEVNSYVAITSNGVQDLGRSQDRAMSL